MSTVDRATRLVVIRWMLTTALFGIVACSKPSKQSAPAASPGSEPALAPAAQATPTETPSQKPASSPQGEAKPSPQVAEATEPPALPANSVLRPVFETRDGTIRAGTAFLLRWNDDQVLLLTAQHLLGRAGGLPRDYKWTELPEVVKRVTARSADDPAVSVSTSQVVSIPDAAPQQQQDLRHDIAAFRVEQPGSAGVLRLAAEAPRADERVYLLAEVEGSQERLHPARVGAVVDTLMSYTFDGKPTLRATKGAPVLNARGEVVGINLAGGLIQGAMWGYANPLASIREQLARATRAN